MAAPASVRVRFIGGAFPDKFVSLDALRGADPLSALFTAVGATAVNWQVHDLEDETLGAEQLRAIDDVNTVIHLRRIKRTPAPHAPPRAAPPPAKRPRRADGAGGSDEVDEVDEEPAGTATGTTNAIDLAEEEAAGEREREEAADEREGVDAADDGEEYSPVMYSASPTIKWWEGIGKDFPMWNALLELVDNAVRALIMRAELEGNDAPNEIYIFVWQEPGNGVWCLSVRDTGIGMNKKQIGHWATLGAEDGSAAPVECVNPAFPGATLSTHACAKTHHLRARITCVRLSLARAHPSISRVCSLAPTLLPRMQTATCSTTAWGARARGCGCAPRMARSR
jgi:hypothetical protein